MANLMRSPAAAIALVWGLAAALEPAVAIAQVLPPEPVEIAACLCLQQSVSALGAEMNAKNQALESIKQQLADLDSQLARDRSTINVNNPDAVARYKALLERRDASYRQSIGPAHAEATQAAVGYNQRVGEYNARCANRPFNSAIVAQVQATLACPPPR